MAKRLQHRGGTTAQHSTFTGAVREVTVDTDKNTLVVHDGATAGGHPLATTTNFTSTGIDDNATSTAITIDSSQNVGINDTSPDGSLHITRSGSSLQAVLERTTSNTGKFGIGINSGLVFNDLVTSTERMRINSAGSLLVGTTTTTIVSTTGVRLYADGRGFFTASSNYSAYFNRLTSDGQIISLNKDGTTVGSIGARFGGIQIGSSDTGLLFNNSSKEINPTDADGTVNDNLTILGANNRRFKDLFLGGGVYLGGTGTANKLDDYEEGTWTPTVNTATGFSTGATNYTGTSAPRYTKIGNRVFLQCQIQMGNSSGNVAVDDSVVITNLPFTPADIERNTVTEYRYNNNTAYMTSYLTATPSIVSIVRFLKGTALRNGGAINININFTV